VGIGKYSDGDAVQSARKPNLDWLGANAIASSLLAHGVAVGLPSDEDMGNSEVGHNAIGCGRVFAQGAKLVSDAIGSGGLFRGPVWLDLIKNCLENRSTLHFIGLFSDGNVHSHIDHLKAMLSAARKAGVSKARIHILLDGRDVGETSALEYVDPFEAFLAQLNSGGGTDYRIASGGGRMKVTMDRYGADWNMVKTGWATHVAGLGPAFSSAREAILQHRKDNPGVTDQDLPPFVVVEDGKAVGPIVDGDSVVFFNFRGDRAIEISRAFEDDDLTEFKRSPRPKVKYAGMMRYDGDLGIPRHFLVEPPAIDRTMSEYLAGAGVRQFAISETQKFGHVTYFFNGNRSGKFSDELEEYVEIPSDRVPFEQRPWMKAADITDRVISEVERGAFPFMRLNFPNGDMVGHTGIYQATQVAVETVDLCLGRIMRAIKASNGIMVVSADHGNADEMFEHDAKTGIVKINKQTGERMARTAHSLNPVPVYVYDPSGTASLALSCEQGLGISSLAATCISLLGYEPPEDYTPAVVRVGP
ncbi:MAG: 2,3-bisphosphoglycerate-independent phosphoglycerate mutase, partial [bacterium]